MCSERVISTSKSIYYIFWKYVRLKTSVSCTSKILFKENMLSFSEVCRKVKDLFDLGNQYHEGSGANFSTKK